MAQLQRVEGQIELKCHADKLFDIYTSKAHLIPKITPNKVPKVELLEGEWDKKGAVINWTYLINDNGEPTVITGKTRTEELDIENRTYLYNVIDGYARENYYKTFKGKIEVTPKGEGCIMKLSLEFEKLKDDAPEPNEHIDAEFDIAKDIDAYLCST